MSVLALKACAAAAAAAAAAASARHASASSAAAAPDTCGLMSGAGSGGRSRSAMVADSSSAPVAAAAMQQPPCEQPTSSDLAQRTHLSATGSRSTSSDARERCQRDRPRTKHSSGSAASKHQPPRRKNATRETTATLKDWLEEHGQNPYPTKGEKIMLSIITKMSLTQVSTWFANARRRMKKENKALWLHKPTTTLQSAAAALVLPTYPSAQRDNSTAPSSCHLPAPASATHQSAPSSSSSLSQSQAPKPTSTSASGASTTASSLSYFIQRHTASHQTSTSATTHIHFRSH